MVTPLGMRRKILRLYRFLRNQFTENENTNWLRRAKDSSSSRYYSTTIGLMEACSDALGVLVPQDLFGRAVTVLNDVNALGRF